MAERKSSDKGLTRLEPNWIIGYTTRRHLCLDLDDADPEKVIDLAITIQEEYPEVGDCLVMLSSDKPLSVDVRYSWNNSPWVDVQRPNYHLIFDNEIGYNKICKICETLAALGVLNKDYSKIRTFRGDVTLRVSHQNMSTGSVKPAPIIEAEVLKLPLKKKRNMIDQYLSFRRAVLRFTSREFHPKTQANDRANSTDYRS